MPRATLQAWLSLYAAVGVMVAMCAVLAMIKTAHDYRTGTSKLPTATVLDKVLVAPRLWIRWQINYLLGAPAILGIAIYYAHYLGFDTLVDV